MKYVIILALVTLPVSLFSMESEYTKYQNVQEAYQEMPTYQTTKRHHHRYQKPSVTAPYDASEEIYEKNW